MASWTLTSHLLALDPATFTAATQSPFLAAAGAGRLPKSILGIWLANDRLYIHAYLKAACRTLAAIDLPQTTPATPAPETELVDWLVTSLAELRREERLFIDVARRYGLTIDLETELVVQTQDDDGGGREVRRVPERVKSAGLVGFERLFGSLHPAASVADSNVPLPWLEAAVVFWGTERVYWAAWTWAAGKQVSGGDGEGEGERDEDGGALRREFIPNWSHSGFGDFVEQLGGIVDRAVDEVVGALGEEVRAGLVKRAEKVWTKLVAAETAFWPHI